MYPSVIQKVAIPFTLRMEKRRPPPNAAPLEFVAGLQLRAERLGVPWKEAVRRAQLGRQSAWRLAKGTASFATARRVEAALDQIEKKRGGLDHEEREQRIAAWMSAGRELLALDRARFDELLGQVQLLAERIRIERAADEKLKEILAPKPR